MTGLSVIAIALLGMAVVQAIGVILFVRLFFRRPPKRIADEDLPYASILLPLRGADPKLAEVLSRLLKQDYPRYDIHIVIDRREDPAWDVVVTVLRQMHAENVHVSAIERRPETCSPQCRALTQAVEGLDDQCRVVVIVDGDVMTHRTWLRELVEPVLDEQVGIAHGNRWFIPPDAKWGSLVRYLWNAGAVVPMYFFGIPWGGSLAIRRSVLHDSGLVELWSRSAVQDAPAVSALKKLGLCVKFVPSLMMVNRESCGLSFCYDFAKRQMMWTRIYHPHWWPVLAHAIATSAVLSAAAALFVWALLARSHSSAIWLGCGLVGYLAALMALLGILEIGVRRVVRDQGEQLEALHPLALVKLPLAIPLTQCVYVSAALFATFKRRVMWRGIVYEFRKPFDVRLIVDRPFEQSAQQADGNVSI